MATFHTSILQLNALIPGSLPSRAEVYRGPKKRLIVHASGRVTSFTNWLVVRRDGFHKPRSSGIRPNAVVVEVVWLMQYAAAPRESRELRLTPVSLARIT